MVNIVEKLDWQRNGGRRFNDIKFAFKDLYGFSGNQSEVCGSPLFACRFSPVKQYGNLIAFANEAGIVEVKNSNSKDPGIVSQAHMNAIFDLCWTNVTSKIITASGDHTANLWDVGEGSIKSVLNFKGHSRSVKTVSSHPSCDDLFASGSRDGNLLLWDCRVASTAVSSILYENIIFSKKGCSSVSVTSVCYLDDNHLISVTANEGCLKVWDTRRSYSALKRLPVPAYVIPPPGNCAGYSCVTVDPAHLLVYANARNNNLYTFSVANYDFNLRGKFTGHEVNTFYIKHSVSRDGNLVASGSGDGKAYIWDTKYPGPPLATLTGHSTEVTAVDWSHTGDTKMVTCSEDMTYMIWKLYPHEKNEINEDIRGFTEDITLCRQNITKSITRKPKTTCHASCKRGKIIHTSPVKSQRLQLMSPPKKKLKLSPMKKSPMKRDIAVLLSPTANLPNLVIDGVSPHQHECRRSPRQHPDWLTRLREGRTPHRSGKSPSTLSPSQRIARRRSSASKSPSLLEFFSPSCTRGKPRSLNFSHLPANTGSS